MRYSYLCKQGHASEVEFAIGRAQSEIICPHTTPTIHMTRRDYASDFASHTISTGDPFRAYHLSSAKTRAAGEQGREIGGPTDNFERKRDELVRGVKYVGNDTGGMSAAARRGIEKAKAKK